MFEPRSATACRAIHQTAYETAFASADRVLLAPLGRTNIPESERLDIPHLIQGINAHGPSAEAPPSVDAIVATLVREAKSGDTIALLSNGAFGGIHQKLLAALAQSQLAG